MENADTLARMRDHQDRIIAILDRAAVLIGGEPDASRAALASARWEMARRWREYELLKHRELFDPLIVGGTMEQRTLARQMKADSVLLGEDFQVYVAHWSGVDIADRWVDYRRAMQAITTRLRNRVIQDRAALARLWPTSAMRPTIGAGGMRTTVRG